MTAAFSMRINKYFTEKGICSRRSADKAIEEGRVRINSTVAKLGDQVKEGDKVYLNGKEVGLREPERVVVAFHKPRGYECTNNPAVKNIFKILKFRERLFYIGRLDKDSEGLLLLTNQGDLVNPVLRSENEKEKEYLVDLDDLITDEHIEKLSKGVVILDRKTKPCVVERLGPKKIRMVLTEGLNRQIRRMVQKMGLEVKRLKRIRVVNVKLGDLKEGEWRELSALEQQKLFAAVGVPSRRSSEL